MERKEEFQSYYDSTILNKLEELEPERKKTRNKILLTTLLVIIANFVTAFLLNVNYSLTVCIYGIIAIAGSYMITKSIFGAICVYLISVLILYTMLSLSKEPTMSVIFLQILSVCQLPFLRASLKEKYVENYKETVMNLVTKFIDAELEFSVDPSEKRAKLEKIQRKQLEKDFELSFPSASNCEKVKEFFILQNMSIYRKEKLGSNKINEYTIMPYEFRSMITDVLSRLNKKKNLSVSIEDYIYGNYQQQPLCVVESKATYRFSRHYDQTVFKGLIFMTSKQDISDLEMFLKFKGNSFLNFEKNDFKVGNEQFDNLYTIECSNEESGLKIFNSFTVSKLLNYVQNTKNTDFAIEESGLEISNSFTAPKLLNNTPNPQNIDFAVYNNKILVFVPNKKNSFEPKIFKRTFDFNEIYGYYKDLQFGIDMINVFM